MVNPQKIVTLLWIGFATFCLTIVVTFILLTNGKLGFMPSFKDLENPPNDFATEVLSEDSVVLGKYFFTENRTYITYKQIPETVIQALIATEDARFFEHSGIDLRSLFRVLKGLVLNQNKLGGGSTITQQLAKMLFPRKNITSAPALILRKFKEWTIAVKLEKSYTKQEIITMYLNKYDFLNLAVGIHSAAAIYFNTTPEKLKIEQSAMLVGMAQNSSLFNPIKRPDLTLKRRNVVLAQMRKYGYLSRTELDSLKQLPLGLDYHPVDFKQGPAPHFREYLRRILTASKPIAKQYPAWQKQQFKEDSAEWEQNPLYGWCEKNKKTNGLSYNIYTDGLKIYTTINARMQQYAEEAINKHLKQNLQPKFSAQIKNLKYPPFSNDLTADAANKLILNLVQQSHRYRLLKQTQASENEITKAFNTPTRMRIFSWKGDIDTVITPIDSIKWYLQYFRSSLMSVEQSSGKVKAYAGAPNYKYFMYDMVKMGKRQVGSTVKPFLYTLAMQSGYTPCTQVPFVRQPFVLPDGSIWEPEDEGDKEDAKYGELVTLKWGLANSKNTVSAWVMKQFNPLAAVSIMQKQGIYSYIDPVPSIFLGTAEISLYEMTAAFTVYGNQGTFTKPYFVTHITDRHGNVIANFKPSSNEALDPNTAYLMLCMLQGVIDGGTASRLRYSNEYGKLTIPIAGKTGTTQNHSDGWFIALTPQLTTGVWTGASLRSVHFASILDGQGANTALPIWGYFMQKVLADSSLHYSQQINFKAPTNFEYDLLNCSKSGQQKSPNNNNPVNLSNW